MSQQLLDLCNLIADEGAKHAGENTKCFLEVLSETTGVAVPKDQANAIFKVFSFLNWAYSNGVWSNLSKTALRRDLMRQSMRSIVLRTARAMAVDTSVGGTAHLASNLDREFDQHVQTYNARIAELAREGTAVGAKTATLVGLEWIQRCLALTDKDMNVIVPRFNDRIDVARIEDLAIQMNRVADDRKSGFDP